MSIRNQIRPVLTLALPLILAEVGWMSMGIVDTIMVGHMANPALAISAAALGQVLYNTIAFGIAGVLLGLDTYLAQSHGAGRFDEANRWLLHGLLLAAGLALTLILIIVLAPTFMLRLPIDHEVLTELRLLPRRTQLRHPRALPLLHPPPLPAGLQPRPPHRRRARHREPHQRRRQLAPHLRPLLGPHPHPRARRHRSRSRHLRLSLLPRPLHRRRRSGASNAATTTVSAAWFATSRPTRIRRLALLGAPAGGQIFVEIAIFGLVTFLIGTMGRLPLAGHEIALNCASFTFMVPYRHLRRRSSPRRPGHRSQDARRSRLRRMGSHRPRSRSHGLLLRHHLPLPPPHRTQPSREDPAVIAATIPLLFVAAIFQFFDGLQITATGALRGAGNTHAGLYVQIIGYWIIGLPIGYLIAFRLHHGAVGLWLGLCAGLIVAGTRPHHHLAPHHPKAEDRVPSRSSKLASSTIDTSATPYA